ncbi:transforming protein [Human papillomavirus 143]|uniref:Protein E7 n=1 Tax=Human papillomavirus 143 TaxID=1070416 RepID=I3P6N9_9PAPI|nr:transforming protein [Human papillomavirus 143]
MIGKEVTVQDIVLELSEVQPEVLPVDLFCEEELPNEQETEEELDIERIVFKVIAPCGCSRCEVKLRIFVCASEFGIRSFQQLLTGDLQLLCPECRGNCKHGGS